MDEALFRETVSKELMEANDFGKEMFNVLGHLPNVNTVADIVAVASYLRMRREQLGYRTEQTQETAVEVADKTYLSNEPAKSYLYDTQTGEPSGPEADKPLTRKEQRAQDRADAAEKTAYDNKETGYAKGSE